jgi:hypothetical protein
MDKNGRLVFFEEKPEIIAPIEPEPKELVIKKKKVAFKGKSKSPKKR